MPDRQSATELNAAAVGRALRGLPSATPSADGWAALAASLQAQGLVRAADDATPGGLPRDTDAATIRDDTQPDSAGLPAHAPRRGRAVRTATPRRQWLPVSLAAALALVAVALLPARRADSPSAPLTTTSITNAPPANAPPATTAATAAPATGDVELAQLRGESARIEEWLRLLKADETPLDGRSLMAATEIEDMIGLIDLQLAAGNDSGGDTQALWRSRVALLRDLAAVRTTYSLAGTGIAANGTAAMPDNWTPL